MTPLLSRHRGKLLLNVYRRTDGSVFFYVEKPHRRVVFAEVPRKRALVGQPRTKRVKSYVLERFHATYESAIIERRLRYKEGWLDLTAQEHSWLSSARRSLLGELILRGLLKGTPTF